MLLLRFIAIVLLCGAIAAIGWEIYISLQAEGYRPIAMGEWWYRLDVTSLNLAQAVVQRYVHPFLWESIVAPVLTWPLWIVTGVPGLLLLAVSRWRSPRAKPGQVTSG